MFCLSCLTYKPELFKLEIAKILHNHSKNCLPLVFNNYFYLAKSSHFRITRFFHSDQLIIPLFKTQRSIKYTGAKIWNTNLANVRKNSLNKFRKDYKQILLLTT